MKTDDWFDLLPTKNVSVKRRKQREERESVVGEREGKGKEVKRWESEECEWRENDGECVDENEVEKR